MVHITLNFLTLFGNIMLEGGFEEKEIVMF